MKCRVGFVSNSSSSSFVIVGVKFDNSQLSEIAEKYNTATVGRVYYIREVTSDSIDNDEEFYIGKIIAEVDSDGDFLEKAEYDLSKLIDESVNILKPLGIAKKDIKLYTGTRSC